MSANCLLRNIFLQDRFLYDHCTFLKSSFENILQLFTAIEYVKTQTFLALWVRKMRNKFNILTKNKLRFSLELSKCDLDVRFFRSWKFRQFMLFRKPLNQLTFSSVSFNLRPGLRYLQFKPDVLHYLDTRYFFLNKCVLVSQRQQICLWSIEW